MYSFNLMKIHPSFPVAHKVNNVGIFVLFKFENSIRHFNFISKLYDRCKFALKLFHLHRSKIPTLPTFVYYGKTPPTDRELMELHITSNFCMLFLNHRSVFYVLQNEDVFPHVFARNGFHHDL